MALRGNDRILILAKIDEETKDMGLVDPKILQGKNKLHCYIDQGMWFFRQEHGLVPGPLRNKYTSFQMAKADADAYFRTRNIQIIDVKDDA